MHVASAGRAYDLALVLNTASGVQITLDWEMGSAVTEFRLVDVPELGYHTSDRPFPRGELQLKTQSMIQGYHKQAKACCHCPHHLWSLLQSTSENRCLLCRSMEQ